MINNSRQAIRIIRMIAKHLGMRLKTSPESFYKTRTKQLFTSVADTKKHGKIVFRFSYGKLLKSVQKEVQLYRLAEESGLKVMPEIIESKIGSEYNWMIYKYCDGLLCGNVYQFFKGQNYEKLLELIEGVNNLKLPKIDKELFISRKVESWHRLINTIVIKKPELKNDTLVSKIINLILKYPCPISDRFVHGDLHPGNIVRSNDLIKIIDWESAHFDCYGFDLSFLYIRSYDDEFRKYIIKHIKETSPDRLKDFYYALGVNLIRDYFEWHLIAEDKNELMNKKEIINNASIQEVLADLYSEIKFVYDELKDK